MTALPRCPHISLSVHPYGPWRSSSHSAGTNNCVETARLNAELLAVRDSKDTAGPALLFGTGAWRSFVGELTDVRFAHVR
ncbi:DUF397 domain-containing protein [Streptomyces sp. MST-110588]|uniref:DUF397 domain-containing protein n=1 Tax=Streptomyces sp. MST-110588 TaxID=2833628 RepID=UPI001F5CE3F3|nr:DUF397 domain-containing protein [Streptomyces sp. MST-110588]UNO38612.1 DUF397 domain-containing protein [Streptomyces sp. MST-110588]